MNKDTKNYPKSQIIDENTNSLIARSITTEMNKSFLEYAMSVIVSRALPNIRDGLKPVHRRILYAMSQLGLEANKAHKKSARIVGEVLGKYHPHGDIAAYEAMVRMAQPFSMRYPLVDGHGNFGSIDGDSAAAMRYTEVRMTKISQLLIDTINKNTVDFVANYDATEKEPVILPARFPNLLVNGATGIAVGMATNIPPHNLGEVIDALLALLKNPKIEFEELNQYVKGPDFPTSASILGKKGIVQAYQTGNGAISIRAKTKIIKLNNGNKAIIVFELPFMVNKARLIEKIATLVKNKQILGIIDLSDQSSHQGIKILIETKKSVVTEVVLNKLFKLTELQTKFNVNMLALIDGEPKKLTLKLALEKYLQHLIEITKRQTQFELKKAQERAHLLQGFIIALKQIDQVISIIRKATSDKEALANLVLSLNLSEKQAQEILNMKLSRLTSFARNKIEQEASETEKTITNLKMILDNPEKLKEVINKQLNQTKDKFADSRRTEILVDAKEVIDDEDLIPKKNIVITMSDNGYIKRIDLDEYRLQNRGGVGSKSISTYDDDVVAEILITRNHDDLLLFSNKGKVFRLRAYQIPEYSKQAKGMPLVNLLKINQTEKIISLLKIKNYDQESSLFTFTKQGVVKATKLTLFKKINSSGKIALKLKPNDELIKTIVIQPNQEIVIGTYLGKVVKFLASQVRNVGRNACGVRGVNLKPKSNGNYVIGASSSASGNKILAISNKGFAKMTKIDEYRQTKRGAKGVKTLNVKKAGKLVCLQVVDGLEDVLIITKNGKTIRINLKQINTLSRNTKGVKIIDLKEKIVSIALIKRSQIEAKIEEIHKTQEILLN